MNRSAVDPDCIKRGAREVALQGKTRDSPPCSHVWNAQEKLTVRSEDAPAFLQGFFNLNNELKH
jgi:hypothetical protein